MPKVHMEAGQGWSGGNGGRRRRGTPRVATTLAEINVVPLVDVMLVLLVIFMVTAPMMQQGLAVNLPEARRADPVAAQPVYVTVPLSYRADGRVQLGDEFVRIDLLAERVRQALGGRRERDVFLRTDGAVTMQEVMQVFDRLKEAGVERVGILTRPPSRPS
jgi:biopolymer transport protein TolR